MQKPSEKIKKRDILERFYTILIYDKDGKDVSNELTEEEKDSISIEDVYSYFNKGKSSFKEKYSEMEIDNDYDTIHKIEKYDLEFLSSLHNKYKNSKNSDGNIYDKLYIDTLIEDRDDYKTGYYIYGEYEESDEEYSKRLKEYDAMIKNQNKLKEEKKKAKEAKMAKKQQILDKMTDEEKEALGLK
jgi:hypothetical protein